MSITVPALDSAEPHDFYGALSVPLSLGSGTLRAVVKDNFDIAGFATACGSERLSRSAPAVENAQVVGAILDAGVRLVGRAKMHELAYGVTGINHWSGTPANPCDADVIPGGSSSGCAVAVAAGLADFALGTDTGGSVRVPAACCGVIGLKTTYGLLSRKGLMPANSSLDCIGVFARDFRTIGRVMDLIAPDNCGDDQIGVQEIHILHNEAEADIRSAFDQAVEIADLPFSRSNLTTMGEAFNAGLTIIGAEMWEEFAWLAPDYAGIGADVAERLQRASAITTHEVRRAREVAKQFTQEVDDLLGTNGFLVLPTLPSVPPSLKEAENASAQIRLTELVRPFNVSGHPAISFPVWIGGRQTTNIQIVGRRGADAELCTFASRMSARISHQIGVSS
jgi:amidase